jgi:hypothetical protein
VFSADGKTLYTGHTVRGWGKPAEGVQRITWSGKTPFDVQNIALEKVGFTLKLTKELSDLATTACSGPMPDQRDEKVTLLLANADTLKIDVQKLEPLRVYQITLDGLSSREGELLVNKVYYYTLNELKKS